MTYLRLSMCLGLMLCLASCSPQEQQVSPERVRVLLDTDANNELDDQHAIAYMLLSGEVFEVEGLTVNRTDNGGDIHEQAAEAERVVRLCGLHPQLKVLKGASASFEASFSSVGLDISSDDSCAAATDPHHTEGDQCSEDGEVGQTGIIQIKPAMSDEAEL